MVINCQSILVKGVEKENCRLSVLNFLNLLGSEAGPEGYYRQFETRLPLSIMAGVIVQEKGRLAHTAVCENDRVLLVGFYGELPVKQLEDALPRRNDLSKILASCRINGLALWLNEGIGRPQDVLPRVEGCDPVSKVLDISG